MSKERILVAVKTYPVLSKSYMELACTAGFREDGSWVRIYPIPFRLLDKDQHFQKYQWIELALAKNPKDSRPESYRPLNRDDITLCEKIGTEQAWAERKRIILKQNKIYTNLAEIIAGANDNKHSLVIFKPKEILGFVVEKTERSWGQDKLDALKAYLNQGNLFDEAQEDFKVMPKLPYKFSYKFVDDSGTESTLMIEDWEIGQLYWSCVKGTDEKTATQKVRQKYFEDFSKTKDLHLFLGTTREFHGRAPNPFLIIGTFHPPIDAQSTLF
jgi:hypothetical protein